VQARPLTPDAASETRLLYLDPRRLVPDAENVRREVGDLQSLAASLRQYGVLQPLGVIPLEDSSPSGAGRYRVVYGNRRRAAAILAGLPAVPCLPLPQQDGPDPLVAQLLENMQRRDLNDMEKAEGLARLRRFLAAGGAPDFRGQGREGAEPESGPADGPSLDERLGALVGLAPRTVRRYLTLRSLPPAVRDLLAEERLTVTQAQHLHQLPSPALQEQVGARAAAEEWTAALVSRVCAALARTPGSSLDEALRAAGSGWEEVERLGPAPRPEGGAPQVPLGIEPLRGPRPGRGSAATDPGRGELTDEAGLWLEDATGAPTPEALGEPDPFAAPVAAPGARGAAGAGLEPETRDGHRVFRIRTLSAFCDEVDRLARCLQDGDLARAAGDDPAAPTRLRLAAKQLAFTLRGVEGMLA
jgi:ParB family chromosome partitioning protein